MQANPEKCQANFLAPGHKKVQTYFSIDNINIKPEKSVKHLGIELDDKPEKYLPYYSQDKLKFDIQVSSMCKKAAKQLNSLWHALCTFIQHVQGTYNILKRHARLRHAVGKRG